MLIDFIVFFQKYQKHEADKHGHISKYIDNEVFTVICERK